VAVPHQGYYELIEEEAELVKQIFEWYVLRRLSMSEIARKMSELGIPTRGSKSGTKRKQNKDVWGNSTIWVMLKNSMYYGEYHWGDQIVPVPAIVSKEMWDEAQRLLAENKRSAKRNARLEYLMRGRMICGLCNRPFYCGSRWSEKGQGIYYCPGQVPRLQWDGKTTTCKRNISRPVIDQTVWDEVVRAIRNPDGYCPPPVEDKSIAALRAELAGINNVIAALNEQYNRFFDLYGDKKINQSVLGDRLMAKQAEIEEQEKRKIKLENELAYRGASELRRRATLDYCQEVRDLLDTFDFAARRKAVEMLDVRATITRGEISDDDTITVTIHSLV
jgi:site-specific DNA recombinase